MKKVIIIIFIVVCYLSYSKKENSNTIIIPDDSIRIRVIASSNNEIDLKFKNEFKTKLEDDIYSLIKGIDNRDEVNEVILNNLDNINISISEYLKNINYKLDYGLNYFPQKMYKGVLYEAGYYDSLVVTLGNGKGSNWWCVLFPPLCLIEENNTTTDVEYQLFVSRIIDKYI